MTDETIFLSEEDEETRHYITFWSDNGFESLIDLTEKAAEYEEWKKNEIFRILKDDPLPFRSGFSLSMYRLRAKYNSHRHYEMYTFSSTMTRNELMAVIASNPQILVDWIRKNGTKVFTSGSPNKDKIV
jgi:hypothetical protein